MVRESGMIENFHMLPFLPLNSKVIIIENYDSIKELKDCLSFRTTNGLGEPSPYGLSGPRSVWVI